MLITLTEEDIQVAKQVAQQRNNSQRSAGRADGLVKGSSIGRDVEGSEAELAVSKALSLPWDGKWLPIAAWDKWKALGNDVGKLEVRSTVLENGRLILHESDKDYSPYILVRSHKRPTFELVGWVLGQEGKKPDFWRDNVPRPCYMVGQQSLKSIDKLLEIINDLK